MTCPFEIFWSIIRSVPVDVVNLSLIFVDRLAVKSPANQAVKLLFRLCAFPLEIDFIVAILSLVRLEELFRLDRPDLAAGRGTVCRRGNTPFGQVRDRSRTERNIHL